MVDAVMLRRTWGTRLSGVSGALAEVFEDYVADGGGDDGDGEICDGEDVVQGDGEGFPVAAGAVEFAHEQVGVEEEDDERDLDDRAADVGEQARLDGILRHGEMGAFSDARGLDRAAAFLWLELARVQGDFIPLRAEIWRRGGWIAAMRGSAARIVA
jgi:hypothetical protein